MAPKARPNAVVMKGLLFYLGDGASGLLLRNCLTDGLHRPILVFAELVLSPEERQRKHRDHGLVDTVRKLGTGGLLARGIPLGQFFLVALDLHAQPVLEKAQLGVGFDSVGQHHVIGVGVRHLNRTDHDQFATREQVLCNGATGQCHSLTQSRSLEQVG